VTNHILHTKKTKKQQQTNKQTNKNLKKNHPDSAKTVL
jgi:hypothetical protein